VSLFVTDWSVFRNFNPVTDTRLGCTCPRCRGIRPMVSRPFVVCVQKGRTAHGIPAIILSGSRCEIQNPLVGGSENSDHLYRADGTLLTCGWDIEFLYTKCDKAFTGLLKQARDNFARFRLLKVLLETTTNNTPIVSFLRAYMNAGLNRFGINYKRNFVHIGLSERNPAEVCWFY